MSKNILVEFFFPKIQNLELEITFKRKKFLSTNNLLCWKFAGVGKLQLFPPFLTLDFAYNVVQKSWRRL